MELTSSYLICATPRSGSTLLCEALRNTRMAGNPDEYFGPMHVERWSQQWQTGTTEEYLEKVLQHGMGDTPVWGGKVMRLYWRNFLGTLREAVPESKSSEIELLCDVFPNLKFIFITRRDKVRQGISWMKFIQGMAWYWESDVPQSLPNLEFRPGIVRDFIHQTSVHESAWMQFFQQNDITPKIVVYEELTKRYETIALEALDFLGVNVQQPIVFKPRKMKQQADSLTDEWVQRYLDYYQDTEWMS